MENPSHSSTSAQSDEELFRQIFEHNSAAIAIIEFDTTISMVNDAYCTMGGFKKEDVLGRSWTTQIPPEDLERLKEYNRRRLADPAAAPDSYEFTFYHKSGEIRHGLMSVSMMAAARKIIASFTDITDRKRAEAALELAHTQISEMNADLSASLEALRSRNEDLDAFTHTVAHDLRSSLNLIIGYAEYLEDSAVGSTTDREQHAVRAIRKTGEKMNDILKELLLLAQVQGLEVMHAPINTADIVQSVLEHFAFEISHSRATIGAPEAWPASLGYGPWIEEVWRNYISNALKYGGERPRIELSAEVRKDEGLRAFVHFRVRDYGIGIEAGQQARLFHPFTRLMTVPVEGQGLGLSIVRRIVEKLGGSVSVKSSGVPGEGSEFEFVLPAVSGE